MPSKIILASKSKVRKEILDKNNIESIVEPSNIDEDIVKERMHLPHQNGREVFKNAVKRIKTLKSSDDGFLIAEEDLKLRGFGDLIGYQQSGIKNFRFADPVIHEDLFKLAEKYVQGIKENVNEPNRLIRREESIVDDPRFN